ncbi:TIGR01212 family radical SAM protein [Nitrosophilus kaiyonis]|uniref:TIGR01212 family radical SAM protein n=1 Tax=Nitrosophilus kaiyonis TaxID=2930200 RepID=UPI002490959E|nr:TIGR01212 family radical SAM protein [Nitrosophilus kaiyonis]
MKEILTFGRYYKKKIKKRVKKIPLGISGFTCPNIDGTVAKGGCSFCENESFSPNLAKNSKKFFLNPDSKENPILQKQLLEVQFQYNATRDRYKSLGYEKFLAYFQAFTNTYAPLDTLKALYEKALIQKDCIGLSIGTRSDSVNEDILNYLKDLDKNYDIWVEYGIQSIFDETLKKINRGHDSKNIETWIKKTKDKGLKVCGHIIFGLPDENQEMMLKTVEKSIEWGIDSIKFHPLYVVKNTMLAVEYKKGEFKPISKELYIDTLVKAIKMLPKDMFVQRVTAGIDDETLLAPNWCKNKNALLKEIREALRKEGYIY